jgi:hypothetical protein
VEAQAEAEAQGEIIRMEQQAVAVELVELVKML